MGVDHGTLAKWGRGRRVRTGKFALQALRFVNAENLGRGNGIAQFKIREARDSTDPCIAFHVLINAGR